MNLIVRFQRLTLWNKLGVIGAFASMLSVILAIIFFICPDIKLNKQIFHQGKLDKYSLIISYNEDAKTMANHFEAYLVTRKDLEVQMKPFQIKGGNKYSYSIKFYYRDATIENLAVEIWTNLQNISRNIENRDIEKRLDSTINSEFKIFIE